MSLFNLIEIATDEKQTEDDWTKILNVCEKGSNNPKECLKLILKRMFNRNPHIVLRSIILLDACVQNIGESFAKEISSRYFVAEIKTKSKTMHQKALERLCFMTKKWKREFSGNEFDFITELNKWLQDTYPTYYAAGDDELNSRNIGKAIRKEVVGQEEADLAKAIALSLQETESKRVTSYPSFTNAIIDSVQPKKSTTKARALYDFEAAEENELTFKAGEIIIDVDTSNEHWWTGSNHRGEGMFPAQFVTLDLDVNVKQPVEPAQTLEGASAMSDQLSDSLLAQQPNPVIDESKIDACIHLIEDADPTGELRPDPAELAKFEAQCRSMGPLIDQELEKVDRHYNRLSEINKKIMDSYQMYDELMTQGGMTRLGNYMWQPRPVTTTQYFPVAQDQSLPGMLPRLSQSMTMYNGAPQLQPVMNVPQIPQMSYYGPMDGSQINTSGNNQAPSGFSQPFAGPAYPFIPHMSLGDGRPLGAPPSESGPTNESATQSNIGMMTYAMHNSFPTATYPYSTNNHIENSAPFASK